jgi:putative hemolysin
LDAGTAASAGQLCLKKGNEMDVELTFDADKNEYCVFRGCDLVVVTKSYSQAIKKFDELCEQVRSIK